jgi:hypothetical protein
MNKDNLTQAVNEAVTEAERKAVDKAINILLIFILALVAFSAGYFVAMSEASALVKAILN